MRECIGFYSIIMKISRGVSAVSKFGSGGGEFNPYKWYDKNYTNSIPVLYKNQFNTPSIDPALITVVNPDPTKVAIVQEKGQLRLKNLGNGTFTFLTNYAITPDAYTGAMHTRFSLNNFDPSVTAMVMIYVDANNRLGLIKNSDNRWVIFINQGGQQRYSLTSAFPSCAVIRISISATNVIQFFQYLNGWVQVGTDQTWNLGANKKFMAYLAGDTTHRHETEMCIGDLYIHNVNFNTLYP